MSLKKSSSQGRQVGGYLGQLLEYFASLHPKEIDFSLERIEALLAKLDHPENHLPPTIHVAGTNGKGSTIASMLAIAQAQGLRVHVMTSPHLIKIEERFRVAGKLVTRPELIKTLQDIKRVNAGAPITIFELLTVAGFLLFSRHSADLCIIEVGLGGRLDATNVITHPKLCVITPISIDHEAFLGDDLGKIAFEKAGIFKNKVPIISAPQKEAVACVLRQEAQKHHAPLWFVPKPVIHPKNVQRPLEVCLPWNGQVALPMPSLKGPWQCENVAVAYAAMKFLYPQLSDGTASRAVGHIRWPGRMQELHGSLATILPPSWELWVDGGHNEGACEALSQQFAKWQDRPLFLLIGMKEGKDVRSFIEMLSPYATEIWAVSEADQYQALSVEEITGQSFVPIRRGGDVVGTLRKVVHVHSSIPSARVVICGSLYLAGLVLERDGYQSS